MGFDVFIVHAAPDENTALLLRHALAERNVSAFVAKPDTPPGMPWDTTIDRELRESLLQVVLIGKGPRWYQTEEITIAIEEMRAHGAEDRVVPVLLTPRKELPYGLNRVQALAWEGPSTIADELAKKVAVLRGARVVQGKLTSAQRSVRVAVLGFRDELSDALDRLRRRIGQRTAILDGDVQVVDLARDTVPDVDLRVVLLGSRHCGRFAFVNELVTAARVPSPRNTIVGAIDIPMRQVPGVYMAEAVEMQSLQVAITSTAVESIIDQLDQQLATWYATCFPSSPGMSITRERWEERYLEDKTSLWRKGDPSVLRSLGGTRADRVRWYVHLKAARPWVEVDGEVRFQFPTSGSPVFSGDEIYGVSIDHRNLPKVPAQLARAGGSSRQGSADTSLSSRTIRDSYVARPVARWTSDRSREFARGAKAWVFGLPSRHDAHHHAEPQQPWLDAILSHALLPRCVVVGSAGAGKTVLLQHLAWVLATDIDPGTESDRVHRIDRDGVRGDCPTPPVPILHSATTLATHLRGDRPIREALVALLRSSETFGDVADPSAVRAGIDAGRYVFLIDSLDEVPRRQDREALVAALGTLSGAAPRVILTTRPSAHTTVELPDGFVRIDIAPLDENTAFRLTRAWIACWAPDEAIDEVLRAVATVRRDFPAQTDERSPVENPLLLSCILHVYTIYRRLPDDAAKLYYDMVRVLCESKIRAADDRDRDTLVENYREALRELFFASQELGGTRLSITSAHELLVARRFVSRGGVENWMQTLANHTGLIRFEGVGDQVAVRPWHRSYQEYLTAEAIALTYANRASDCIAWLRESRPGLGPRLSDPSWRGTLRFLVGAAAHQHRAWGVNLIDALMAAAAVRPFDQARLHALAVEGAAEYATSLFQNETLREVLPQMVIDAFALDGKDWPVIDRLDALDAVGRLGDPRLPDPQIPGCTDPGWVEVQAGQYAIGSAYPAAIVSKKSDDGKEAEGGSALQLMTRESVGFWIRRWPVTVAEFLSFVDSTPIGLSPPYDNPWWAQFAGLWRAQARCPTRPIVGVDWFIARAFCAWAQVHWNLPCEGVIDLPTSGEWEIAARRKTARMYPWGDDKPGVGREAAAAYTWDGLPAARAGATPVGAFPRGHTPEGLWDIGGNVFEWCASRYVGTADHDLLIDGADDVPPFGQMVYRGGCWSLSADFLRVVHRGCSGPSAFSASVGFRVVCRPSSGRRR